MYCAYCGTKNNKDDRFCVKCGKPLTEIDFEVLKVDKSSVIPEKQNLYIGKLLVAIISVLFISAAIWGISKILSKSGETDQSETPKQKESPVLWKQFVEVAQFEAAGDRIVVSPDGNLLAYPVGDKDIAIWDLSIHQVTKVLQGHGDGILYIVFSPDGKTLASSSYDWTVILWDLEDGSILHKLDIGDMCGIHFLDEGKTMVTDCFETRSLIYWDSATGQKTLEYYGQLTKSPEIEFSPLGNALLQYGFATTYVHIYDRDYVNQIGSLTFNSSSEVVWATFLPDGMNAAASFFDGKFGIWNIDSEAPWFELEYSEEDRVQKIFTSAGDPTPYAALILRGKSIDLVDINAQLVRRMGNFNYSTAVFSPDSNYLALGTSNTRVEIWELPNGIMKQAITGLEKTPGKLLFGANGDLLIVVPQYGGMVKIFQRK